MSVLRIPKTERFLVSSETKPGVRHEVWITGAERAVYFGWNPDFPAKLQSKAVTLTRKDLDIPAYEKEAMAFLAEVETEYQALRTASDLHAVLEESA